MILPNLTAVAAIGRSRELGKSNDLCWKISEDLQFYRNVTMGKFVAMGENTFFSLPPKGLPGRKFLVLSPTLNDLGREGEIFRDLDSFLEFAKNTSEEIVVSGGGVVYKLLLPHCAKMILTEIDDNDPDATVFFPEWSDNWKVESSVNYRQNDLTYRRVVYYNCQDTN